MLFRKPTRLEKWIAFDGVGFADIALAGDESAGAGDDNASPDAAFAPFADDESWSGRDDGAADDYVLFGATPEPFVAPSPNVLLLDFPGYPQHDGDAGLFFPVGFGRPGHFPSESLPSYMPFIHADDIRFFISPQAAADIPASDLYLSISFPESGAFNLPQADFSAFVQEQRIPVGTRIAIAIGPIPDSGVNTGTVHVGVVAQGASNFYYLEDRVHVARSYIMDGSLRFGFTGDATHEDIETVLRSLVFTPREGAEDASPSFRVGIYYDPTGTAYTPNKLIEGESCAIQPENAAGVIEDATKECDSDGKVKENGDGNVPSPEPSPEPEEPVVPPVPPPLPPPSGGDPEPGDESGAPPETPGEDAELPDPGDPIVDPALPPEPGLPPEIDPDFETGSDDDVPDGVADAAPSDAEDSGIGGGATGVVDREEEEPEEEEEGAKPAAAAIALPAAGTAAADRGDDFADFIEAFVREAEQAAVGVREIRMLLDDALVRVGAEYAARHRSEWPADARDMLRELIASGNDRLAALARTERMLSREVDVLRATPAERRDGVSEQAIRELTDSAVRQEGEAMMLARCLHSLADLMRQTRTGENPPPAVDELSRAYSEAGGRAKVEWESRLRLRDDLGRDLEDHVRVGRPE